jgi:hypothetical protein
MALVLSLLLSVLLLRSIHATSQVDLSTDHGDYGVDCSYPIHYGIDKNKCPYFYDQYNKMMKGCFTLYSKKECEQNERERLGMNVAQPPTQHNYTSVGFKLMRAPKEAWEPLIEFYNKNKDKKVLEKWYRGATIVNSWDSPTYMVSFENSNFRGGLTVKNIIWEGVRPVIEEWTGHKLEPTSLYGVRIYSSGSILATRKDSFVLALSVLILLHIYL